MENLLTGLLKSLKMQGTCKIQVVSSTKKNVSYQRNLGAERGIGVYVVFLDADCRIDPDFLKNVRKQTIKCRNLIIVPRIYPQDADDFSFDKQVFLLLNAIIAWSQHSPRPFSSGGSMIVEKNFFTFLGGFNAKLVLSEDHDLIHKAHSAGVVASVPKDVTIHFSLRRFHREGRLQVYVKYLKVALKTLRDGGLTQAPFEYKMGGVSDQEAKKNHAIDDSIAEFLRTVKKTFSSKS